MNSNDQPLNRKRLFQGTNKKADKQITNSNDEYPSDGWTDPASHPWVRWPPVCPLVVGLWILPVVRIFWRKLALVSSRCGYQDMSDATQAFDNQENVLLLKKELGEEWASKAGEDMMMRCLRADKGNIGARFPPEANLRSTCRRWNAS